MPDLLFVALSGSDIRNCTCRPVSLTSVKSIRKYSADARQLTRSQHRGQLFTADLVKGVCFSCMNRLGGSYDSCTPQLMLESLEMMISPPVVRLCLMHRGVGGTLVLTAGVEPANHLEWCRSETCQYMLYSFRNSVLPPYMYFRMSLSKKCVFLPCMLHSICISSQVI